MKNRTLLMWLLAPSLSTITSNYAIDSSASHSFVAYAIINKLKPLHSLTLPTIFITTPIRDFVWCGKLFREWPILIATRNSKLTYITLN